jgi:hypothetical protein
MLNLSWISDQHQKKLFFGSDELKRHQLFKLGLRVSNLSFLLHKFDGLVYGV